MKKIISIALIALVSCSTENAEVTSTFIKIKRRDLNVYVIDSCEYIGVIYPSHGDMITHKGNCKFCAKRNSK